MFIAVVVNLVYHFLAVREGGTVLKRITDWCFLIHLPLATNTLHGKRAIDLTSIFIYEITYLLHTYIDGGA
jgi:hypothetical protein